MDKVSVIIPVFNKESFIKSCISSVINQTYHDIEVVIVDDGSSDRSYEIVELMSAEDHRIILIKGKHGGVSDARNVGLARASGKFVVFVDADDELNPDYIKNLVKYSNYDLVVSALLSKGVHKTDIVENAIMIPDESIMVRDIASKIFTKSRYPIFSIVYTKMYRLEIIQKNQIRFRQQAYGEDSLFVLEYLRHTRNIKLLTYAGYINRIVPRTVSRRHIANLWEQIIKVVKYAQEKYQLGYNEGWQYLYSRAMKLELENEVGDYGHFCDFCEHLRGCEDTSYLNLRGLKGDYSAQMVVFLIKFHLDAALYLAYRLMIKGK